MDTIRFKIVTPERIVYESEINEAILPTTGGQITVLPNHVPLVTLLSPGELTVKKDGQEVAMAVSGGFVQVNKNTVVILADTAEHAREIDEKRAEEARARAQKLIDEAKNRESVDYTGLVAKMEKELARIRVARRKRPNA